MCWNIFGELLLESLENDFEFMLDFQHLKILEKTWTWIASSKNSNTYFAMVNQLGIRQQSA